MQRLLLLLLLLLERSCDHRCWGSPRQISAVDLRMAGLADELQISGEQVTSVVGQAGSPGLVSGPPVLPVWVVEVQRSSILSTSAAAVAQLLFQLSAPGGDRSGLPPLPLSTGYRSTCTCTGGRGGSSGSALSAAHRLSSRLENLTVSQSVAAISRTSVEQIRPARRRIRQPAASLLRMAAVRGPV